MPNSDWSESLVLAEWAERECRHLDLIASWETLLVVYEVLGFRGPEDDLAKLGEFKLVIAELNKFLTRMRNGLAKVNTIEDAAEYLLSHSNTSDMNLVKTRPSIAYNKLKQQWVSQSVAVLLSMVNEQSNEGEIDA